MTSSLDGRSKNERNENGSRSGAIHEPIKIDCPGGVNSIAFLFDGKHIVSGGHEGKIRHWRREDGKEAKTPVDAGSAVWNIAISQDAKWVVRLVTGLEGGKMMVWNAESHGKEAITFTGHSARVCAVDVSPDGTRIASGSVDKSVCVWSLSTGERLLGPLEQDNWVGAIKFSPDGRCIATAAESLRIYDSQNGDLLLDERVEVTSLLNQSLAWASDSKKLFALSVDGDICCLDVSTGKTCSRWPIHSDNEPRSIVLARNGTFIAASADSSVSFWDCVTHQQIGSIIQHTTRVRSMAISTNYDLAVCGGETITLHNLHDILPPPYCDDTSREQETQSTHIENADSKRMVTSTRAQLDLGEIARLKETVQQLRDQFSKSQRRADNLEETIRSLRAQEANSSRTITSLEETVQQLHSQYASSQHRVGSLVQILHAHEQKYECEMLCAGGHIISAATTLLKLMNTISEEVRGNKLVMESLTTFRKKCISTLEVIGDEGSRSGKQAEAATAYSTALSLHPSAASTLLTKWARMALTYSSANQVSNDATEFKLPSFVVHRAICDAFEQNDRVPEAIEYFQQVQGKLGEDTSDHSGLKESKYVSETEWITNFKMQCLRKLEQYGDAALDSSSYGDAVAHYTTALTLDPLSSTFLLKRSEARAGIGSWKDSLDDADIVIELDPSSPRGYERKHAALLGAHRYDEAIAAYKDMLTRLERSPDPHTRESYSHYVSPSQTEGAILESAWQNLLDAPLVLVNTETGYFYSKKERVDRFKDDPMYKQLVASTTTRLDHTLITQTVRKYFKYATFSHTWEEPEPLFHDVLHKSVHDLTQDSLSPHTVFKLTEFCATVQKAKLRWAWSDTCCIDQSNHQVLQESLVSMFRWYKESALTIVHLKGVLSDSDLHALERSLWNTRAWTLQEFFASHCIRFYTEDWKPYLPCEGDYNHKDSPAIMNQMAAASGVDAQTLLSLEPGRQNVRQKLSLAAMRTATKREDIAYSLFGILGVSIQANYGEGQQQALGRLLEEVLTWSGDVTILAWTGKPSEYNSCLPAEISVYRAPQSLYIPPTIEDGEMSGLVAELRTSHPTYLESAVTLYDRVVPLQSPRLDKKRLILPCIKFPLNSLSVSSGDSQHVYHTSTPALGDIEIKTAEDLSGMKNLVLVHPWLRCLLGLTLPPEDVTADDVAEPLSPLDEDVRDGDSGGHSPLPSHPASPSTDKLNRSLQLFARFRQPFGALLLAPLSHSEYKRVASDHPIVVQLQKNVSPRYLARSIHALEIL